MTISPIETRLVTPPTQYITLPLTELLVTVADCRSQIAIGS